MKNYVIFKTENQNFGISTTDVEKIFKMTDITKVPNLNYYFEGVINYQEEILPLINIKKLFGMANVEINSKSHIIIVKNDKNKAGIIVDEVDDIEEADDAADSAKVRSQYIEEVKILNGNIISILSPNIVNSLK